MDTRILVVDDVEANRELLARRLQQQGFRVDTAQDGEQALALLAREPFDLVMLDLMMPGLDGSEVLRIMKADPELSPIPVIMVSAAGEMGNVVRCIELGAEDYLTKPINPVLLMARVGACLQRKRLHDRERELKRQLEEHNASLQEQVRAKVRELTRAQNATIFAMSRLAESRDPHAPGRLGRLREYARALAVRLSEMPGYRNIIDGDFIDAIHAATPLLDIGKVAIPDRLLGREGDVDPAEWEWVKNHTLIGGEMLRAVEREHGGNVFIRMGIEIAEGHHEQWDGSGYPRGLKGESIPLSARIVGLVDIYEELSSPRAGRTVFGHDQATSIIASGAGRHFDPGVVAAFLASEAEFVRIRANLGGPQDEAPAFMGGAGT